VIDIALVEDDDDPGHVMAHRLDCPVVRQHRDEDRMIFNLFGISKPLPDDLKRHECMK
jgi:hypothetical protein